MLLDITVLVYAVGSEHPLREPCVSLLQSHTDGRLELATTVEVLQEFAHIHSRRRARTNAVDLARAFASNLALLSTWPEDLDLGFDLYTRHPALGCFDSVLAAVALNRDAEALISSDRAFSSVSGLRWLDPASPALRRLL